MSRDYQLVGFHFLVSFNLQGATTNDVRFQSVSGLNFQMDTESFKEGGENRFEHVMPVRSKTSDLVLKRGLLKTDESALTTWCKDAFENMIFQPIDLLVQLLNEKHEPLVVWNVVHAWPKSWKLGDLSADKGEVLIETFELNYNFFTYKNP